MHVYNCFQSSLFSKCDICVRFASERLKVVGDKSRREQLSTEYKQHLDLVEYACHLWINYKMHKINYVYKIMHMHFCVLTDLSVASTITIVRSLEASPQSTWLHVMIDGMDQNKTNVPHITQQTKSSQNLWRLRTHLTGALIHTKSEKGKLAFAFFDLLQWPHDSNLTITVLTSILTQLQSKLGTIPPILYLQLDNTARENKNKYVFSFLALLVLLKIFRKVNMTVYACTL